MIGRRHSIQNDGDFTAIDTTPKCFRHSVQTDGDYAAAETALKSTESSRDTSIKTLDQLFAIARGQEESDMNGSDLQINSEELLMSSPILSPSTPKKKKKSKWKDKLGLNMSKDKLSLISDRPKDNSDKGSPVGMFGSPFGSPLGSPTKKKKRAKKFFEDKKSKHKSEALGVVIIEDCDDGAGPLFFRKRRSDPEMCDTSGHVSNFTEPTTLSEDDCTTLTDGTKEEKSKKTSKKGRRPTREKREKSNDRTKDRSKSNDRSSRDQSTKSSKSSKGKSSKDRSYSGRNSWESSGDKSKSGRTSVPLTDGHELDCRLKPMAVTEEEEASPSQRDFLQICFDSVSNKLLDGNSADESSLGGDSFDALFKIDPNGETTVDKADAESSDDESMSPEMARLLMDPAVAPDLEPCKPPSGADQFGFHNSFNCPDQPRSPFRARRRSSIGATPDKAPLFRASRRSSIGGGAVPDPSPPFRATRRSSIGGTPDKSPRIRTSRIGNLMSSFGNLKPDFLRAKEESSPKPEEEITTPECLSPNRKKKAMIVTEEERASLNQANFIQLCFDSVSTNVFDGDCLDVERNEPFQPAEPTNEATDLEESEKFVLRPEEEVVFGSDSHDDDDDASLSPDLLAAVPDLPAEETGTAAEELEKLKKALEAKDLEFKTLQKTTGAYTKALENKLQEISKEQQQELKSLKKILNARDKELETLQTTKDDETTKLMKILETKQTEKEEMMLALRSQITVLQRQVDERARQPASTRSLSSTVAANTPSPEMYQKVHDSILEMSKCSKLQFNDMLLLQAGMIGKLNCLQSRMRDIEGIMDKANSSESSLVVLDGGD